MLSVFVFVFFFYIILCTERSERIVSDCWDGVEGGGKCDQLSPGPIPGANTRTPSYRLITAELSKGFERTGSLRFFPL